MPDCELRISSSVRLIILNVLGRTSVGALLPAQQQGDARSSRRGAPFEKSHLWEALLTSTVDAGGWGGGCWAPEEGSTRGDGEPLGDVCGAAVSGGVPGEAVPQRSPVVLCRRDAAKASLCSCR